MTTVAGIRETLFRRRFSHRSLALSLALSLSRFLAFSLPRPLAPSLPRSLVCARVLSLTHSLSLSLSIPLALPLSRSHVRLLSLWPSPQTPPFLSFLSLARFLPLSLSRSLALSLSRPSLSLRSSCCGRPWRKGFRGIHTDPRAHTHTHTNTCSRMRAIGCAQAHGQVPREGRASGGTSIDTERPLNRARRVASATFFAGILMPAGIGTAHACDRGGRRVARVSGRRAGASTRECVCARSAPPCETPRHLGTSDCQSQTLHGRGLALPRRGMDRAGPCHGVACTGARHATPCHGVAWRGAFSRLLAGRQSEVLRCLRVSQGHTAGRRRRGRARSRGGPDREAAHLRRRARGCHVAPRQSCRVHPPTPRPPTRTPGAPPAALALCGDV